MKKISVIGNAAGCKTLISKSLSRATSIPVYSMDQMQINPGWRETDLTELQKKLDEIFKNDCWIIDGMGPLEILETRIEKSDAVLFIDLPLYIHLWWACKRQVYCAFRERSDFVEGCPMLPRTFYILRDILKVDREWTPRIRDMLQQYPNQIQLFHIRSVKELAEFEWTFTSDH
jgi:adenylate kinase family enzyme